jgi:ceramide glucosyltransferase
MIAGYFNVMMQTIAFGLVALSMGLACAYAAGIVLHRPRKVFPRALARFPQVSVFVTLRNMDDGLEENLASIFSSHYPNFTVRCAVDTMSDPCVPVVERVRARFPGIQSTVIAAGHAQTSNPKISKLALLEGHSSAPLIWILDSDVRVDPDTLPALVHEHLASTAAIVFSPIRCRGARTFGSLLEMSYLNFFLSGSVIGAWGLFRQRVIVGKSLLIDRSVLERFGGFSYFADVLAEDHCLGEAFARSGFPVRCNYTWVDNVKETSSVATFFNRLVRWATLRYNLKRPLYVLELLLNPFAMLAVAMPFLGATALPFAGIIIALRIALEYGVLFAVDRRSAGTPAVLLALPAVVLVKDALMVAAFILPFFSSTIKWRGGRIRIGRGTSILFCPESRLLDGA